MALWYDEVHEDTIRFGLRVRETLFTDMSPFQRVEIVDTEALGKALLLDRLWMTAEGDEASYHEMIVHVPMTTVTSRRRVLIIGGGDGGTAREVLSYPDVEHVTMVEIDEMVVQACKEHLPEIGRGAWSDPRLELRFEDGVAFVKEADVEPFDVILVDGSDPVGPAVGLFNADFYRGCARVLSDQGVLVTQSESPRLFGDVHLDMIAVMREVFGHATPYYYPVMIYASGQWSWTYASKAGLDPLALDETKAAEIEERAHIYNADVHRGAFAVPSYVRRAMKARGLR